LQKECDIQVIVSAPHSKEKRGPPKP